MDHLSDYEPLDLTPFCNAPQSTYNPRPGQDAAVGRQMYRGLPFQIGAPECAFILIDRASGTVSVPVAREARNILFAHVLTNSNLHEGEHPGREVARYAVVFSDGERIEVPIRERFEVAVVPTAWGELPFLASPDANEGLMPRYEGKWQDTGFRQTEARQAWAQDYYLWCWKNPRPEVAVERIEVRSTTDDSRQTPDFPPPTLLIAAITLGHVDEEPLHRTAAVPVVISLTSDDDRSRAAELTVDVDRGVNTYPYRLPEKNSDEFLADTHAGLGEKMSESASPVYTEIAASPSATVRVKQDQQELGSAVWGDLQDARTIETQRVRFEVVDTGRNWVHTTVVDADTGKPIPCRIHFRSPRGIPYAPHGHHAHVMSDQGSWHIDVGGDVRLGQMSYAYIDGKCQGWLPRGEVLVDAARGYEYEPLRTRVAIEPGQRELRLELRRKSNLNQQRYFSGDTHVHFLSTQGALTEAAAEDLDVVNLLLSQWGHLFTNTEEFIGRPVSSGDKETIVYATQENRQHILGHLTLLGLKEPVMPWCSDGPSEAELGGNLETTLSYWADATHAQGGTVVIPHLPNPNGEPAALIATGRADAVEMLVHSPFFHLEYYRYLNGGYRLPLAGGTDKMDSGVPVGLYRTYAYIPPDQEFSYDNWCRALRSGNTFLSGGPLIRFTVDGQPMGSTVKLGRDGGTVEVEAVATSIVPVHSLQIVMGGGCLGAGEFFRVAASTEEKQGAKELRLRATLKLEKSGWLCARCAGPGYTAVPHHDSWRRGIMAHTSPVYVACGDYDVFSPDTMHYMLTLVDGTLQYIRSRAPQWTPGTVTHHHGEHDHQAFLERPFHEAAAAIHKKLHEHGVPH